jgi:putative redox protein
MGRHLRRGIRQTGGVLLFCLIFQAGATRSLYPNSGDSIDMKATIEWTGEASFSATSGTGHKVQMDGPPDHGGQNLGPRPMEMLLMGMGGCASFDVMNILKKGRQDVTACRAELSAERADAIPAVFTSIHLHFIVSGNNLKDKQVQRAVSLSAEKYCSASIMFEQAGVKLSHSHEIRES